MTILAHICTTAVTWCFLFGAAGSLLVVVISFVGDLTELLGKD